MKLSDIPGSPRLATDERTRSTRRPRVGITLFSGREGQKFYTKVQYNYVQSIYAAGGLPILIPTLADINQSAGFAATIDALVLTGGEDMSPLTFGIEPRSELGLTDVQRDRWELTLLDACEQLGMPVLGICRGLQVMNVHRGGTLYQDIAAETGGTLGHAPFQNPMESLHHTIAIESGSLMADIFGQSEVVVNSFHHQAIAELGQGLAVSARAPDGVIEGVEDPSRGFFLGVQFHAEALPPIDDYYLCLFTAFVAASRPPRDAR